MLQDGVESFEDASRDDFVSRLGAGFSAAQPVQRRGNSVHNITLVGFRGQKVLPAWLYCAFAI